MSASSLGRPDEDRESECTPDIRVKNFFDMFCRWYECKYNLEQSFKIVEDSYATTLKHIHTAVADLKDVNEWFNHDAKIVLRLEKSWVLEDLCTLVNETTKVWETQAATHSRRLEEALSKRFVAERPGDPINPKALVQRTPEHRVHRPRQHLNVMGRPYEDTGLNPFMPLEDFGIPESCSVRTYSPRTDSDIKNTISTEILNIAQPPGSTRPLLTSAQLREDFSKSRIKTAGQRDRQQRDNPPSTTYSLQKKKKEKNDVSGRPSGT